MRIVLTIVALSAFAGCSRTFTTPVFTQAELTAITTTCNQVGGSITQMYTTNNQAYMLQCTAMPPDATLDQRAHSTP